MTDPRGASRGPGSRRGPGWLLALLCVPGLVGAQGSVGTAPAPALAPTPATAPAPGAPGAADDTLDLGTPLRWEGRFPEQTRDTDGDGVTDMDDNCPGTPRGARVDECGCPADPCRLDADRDGVPDCHDRCPATPAGARVDRATGCPLPPTAVPAPLRLAPGPGAAAPLVPLPTPADPCRFDTDRDGVPDCRDRCPATPPGARVNRLTGCPLMPIARRTRVRLDVKFAFDKADVTAAYGPDIGRLEDLLVRFPELLVTLEGHTDSRGAERYNQRLSEARARAVRRALLADGRVEPARVTAVGFGETRPVADNATESGQAENRRTVAELGLDYRVLPDDQGVLPPALPEEIPLGALTESLQPAPTPPPAPTPAPAPAATPTPMPTPAPAPAPAPGTRP